MFLPFELSWVNSYMENIKYKSMKMENFISFIFLHQEKTPNISRDLNKMRVLNGLKIVYYNHLKCSLLNCLTIYSWYLEKTVALYN